MMGWRQHPESDAIDISALIGLHTLRGIGRDIVRRNLESSQRIVLLFESIVVEILEEAPDSLRSRLGTVRRWPTLGAFMEDEDLSSTPYAISISPISPPLVVTARVHTDKSRTLSVSNGRVEVLYLLDERTGLVVLEIGTDNLHDYYPSFIFTWQPEGWTPPYLRASDP